MWDNLTFWTCAALAVIFLSKSLHGFWKLRTASKEVTTEVKMSLERQDVYDTQRFPDMESLRLEVLRMYRLYDDIRAELRTVTEEKTELQDNRINKQDVEQIVYDMFARGVLDSLIQDAATRISQKYGYRGY